MKKAGIYCIQNLVTGKRYIGQSTNIAFRITRHKHQLRKGVHGNIYLQGAWNKNGEANFRFSILCHITIGSNEATIEELNTLEEQFIRDFGCLAPSGYNLTTGGQNKIVSDATRQRLRDSHKGKPGRPVSAETREKLRNVNLGKTLSSEHRAKLSASRTGKKHPRPHGVIKCGPASEERKRKIGAAQKGELNHNFGKSIPEEVKEKIRASNRGSQCYLAKLTEDQVREIKQRIANGERQANLAREFNVAQTQISAIKYGKTWKHVKI